MIRNWRQHLVLATIAFGGVVAYVHYSREGAPRDVHYLSSAQLDDGTSYVEMAGPPLRDESNRQDLKIVRSLIERNKPTEAEGILRDILARTPDELHARYQLGSVLYLKKEYAAAERVFRELLEEHPEFFRARTGLGAIAYAQGRFQEAIREYSLLIQANPTDALAHFGRGASFLHLGAVSAAEADLEKTLSLLPDNASLAVEARGCLAQIKAREQQGGEQINPVEPNRCH